MIEGQKVARDGPIVAEEFIHGASAQLSVFRVLFAASANDELILTPLNLEGLCMELERIQDGLLKASAALAG